MEPVLKTKRVLRSQADIKRLLDEQNKSGQSIKAFCQANQIPQASFHNWRKKHSKQLSPAGFAAVNIISSAAGPLFAEMRGIKLYQPVSAAYLKELMA
jgi:hypothetical protein